MKMKTSIEKLEKKGWTIEKRYVRDGRKSVPYYYGYLKDKWGNRYAELFSAFSRRDGGTVTRTWTEG